MEKLDSKDVISWLPDGKAFKIHNVEAFANEVLPKFCNGIQYKSFVRNINLYRFERIKDGKSPRMGAYFHPMFTRDNLPMVLKMVRPKRPRKDGKKARIDKTKEFRRKAASTGSLHLSKQNNTNLQTPGAVCLPEEFMAGMNRPQLTASTTFYPGATMNPLINSLRGVVSWSSGGCSNNHSSTFGALQQNQSFRLSNPTPASNMKLGKGLASDLMNDLMPRPFAPGNSKSGTSTENHHMTTTALSTKSTGSLLSSSNSSTTAAATTIKALHMPPPLLNSIQHPSMVANNINTNSTMQQIHGNMTQQPLNPSSPQSNKYFNLSMGQQQTHGDGCGGGGFAHNKTSPVYSKPQQHNIPNDIHRHQNLASNIRQQDSEWMVNVVSNFNTWGKHSSNDATTAIHAADMARSPQNHPISHLPQTRDTTITSADGMHLQVHSTGDSSVNTSSAWSDFPEGVEEFSEAVLLRSLEDCASNGDEQKLTSPAENDNGDDDNICSSIGGFLDDIISIPGDAETTFRLSGASTTSIFANDVLMGGERVATPLDTLDENLVSDWY